MTEIKDRLKQAMRKENLHAVDVCRKTGIPKASISQYLSGYAKPNANKIYLLSEALHVSPGWLLGFEEEQEQKKETHSTVISVGKKLEELEKRYKYTEKYVSDSIGISLSQYQNMKNGRDRQFDSNLLLRFTYFYKLHWYDFFPTKIELVDLSKNVIALQKMCERTSEDICKVSGISHKFYKAICDGKEKPNYDFIDKLCRFYHLTFTSFLGTDYAAKSKNPLDCIQIKANTYLDGFYNALQGESLDKEEMKELIDYIHFLAIKKKNKGTSNDWLR